jgi:hypothetical protein
VKTVKEQNKKQKQKQNKTTNKKTQQTNKQKANQIQSHEIVSQIRQRIELCMREIILRFEINL